MSPLITRLSEICREYLLHEKWLWVPSLRIGHQWLDRVTRSGQPVVNVHLKTVNRVVFDLLAQRLNSAFPDLVSSLGGAMIVQKLWMAYQREKTAYLGSLHPSLHLFQSLYATLHSLKQAEITSQSIRFDSFDSPTKGQEIVRLLGEYETYLRHNDLIDPPDATRMAISFMETDPNIVPSNVLCLIPEAGERSGLERQFFDHLPLERCLVLPTRNLERCTGNSISPSTDLELLQWLDTPSQAPSPFGDGTVTLYSAIGETNEIREVFRRCIGDAIPLDRVELIYTDAQTYLPLIFETAQLLFSQASHSTLPVTFADGIPVRYSRPGKLLQFWVNWIRSDFRQSILLEMLEENLIDCPEDFSHRDIADGLRSIRIGFGRERYMEKILQTIQALEKQRQESFSFYPNEETETESFDEHLEPLQKLHSWITLFWESAPDAHASFSRILTACISLVEQFSRCITELDHNSRHRIIDELQSMRAWIEEDVVVQFDILEWIASLPDQLNVLASGPQEGFLYAVPLQHGGHSGRCHTFIVGLDDARFPGVEMQDPFLLDPEREQLSANLSTSDLRLRNKIEGFTQLLDRLEGRLTLSFSSYDLRDDRETVASSVLINAYRILSGQHEGDLSSLTKWITPASAFSPESPHYSLNESELWMASMKDQACGYHARSSVFAYYPHLGCGFLARNARLGEEYTPYDGWVPEAGSALDPMQAKGLVLSASRFETLGECPLRFFFQYGLKLEAPEDFVLDTDRWLDPLQFGSLMHELFEIFYRELIRKHQKPNVRKHRNRLQSLLGDLIQRYKELIPPPNENAFQKQYRELQECAAIFLRDEENHCQTYTPLYVETAIGIPSHDPTRIDRSSLPMTIHLADGLSFRSRGIVDRVDRIGEESEQTYAIWDYKSGSAFKYDHPDPFHQGRVIQHGLYFELMNQWLTTHVSPHAQIRQFGYFFPNAKGKGKRITWSAEELTHRKNLFRSLCLLIGTGVFPPTNNSKDCRFCDFQTICRDVELITEASNQKLENPLNVRLQPFKELRSDES